ncbi:hypothetical protein NDU88_003579 [Pleurodeles waltl]|uniref:Uncharacterized protein n=1 Tax=Pleurodeles waltl TaxID=8319 RepID=A0AAV7UYV2_PLEWA|nr:hypothetical protein NDU88_003579 [Pleurodeles waltl]
MLEGSRADFPWSAGLELARRTCAHALAGCALAVEVQGASGAGCIRPPEPQRQSRQELRVSAGVSSRAQSFLVRRSPSWCGRCVQLAAVQLSAWAAVDQSLAALGSKPVGLP